MGGGHPWDPGPGRVGSAVGKALLVPSAGTKCCLGPGVTASQPRPGHRAQGPHNNCSSHRSPLLGMVALRQEQQLTVKPHQLRR